MSLANLPEIKRPGALWAALARAMLAFVPEDCPPLVLDGIGRIDLGGDGAGRRRRLADGLSAAFAASRSADGLFEAQAGAILRAIGAPLVLLLDEAVA